MTAPMRLAVVGAAGRMGRTLVRLIAEHPALALAAGIEREGSEALGRDAGELAGAGPLGVPVGADLAVALGGADGIVDFSTPATSRTVAAAATVAGRLWRLWKRE